MTSVDLEREKAYKMGEEINAQLDRMNLNLNDLVKRLNEAQENSMDKSNPVCSILFLQALLHHSPLLLLAPPHPSTYR